MIFATKICADFIKNRESAHIHSSFDRAINFVCSGQILTLLRAPSMLAPHSAVVNVGGDWVEFGDEVSIAQNGIFRFSKQLVDFSQAEIVDLRLKPVLPDKLKLKHLKTVLKNFIGANNSEISGLLFPGKENVYSRLLAPKLRAILSSTNSDEMPERIAAFAGCGVGLTPSSDDFLVGYLLTLFHYSAIPKQMSERCALSAAVRTNDISAAMLKNAGAGIAPEAVLNLFFEVSITSALNSSNKVPRDIVHIQSPRTQVYRHIRQGRGQRIWAKDPVRLANVWCRGNNNRGCARSHDYSENLNSIKNIGSTSGIDMLTGIYFGLDVVTHTVFGCASNIIGGE